MLEIYYDSITKATTQITTMLTSNYSYIRSSALDALVKLSKHGTGHFPFLRLDY